MATLVKTPLDPPSLSYGNIDNYFSECEKYRDDLAALAQKNGDDPLIGRTVRWQRADGFAEYIVWNVKPLQIAHVPTGDAWTIEAPLIRGLNRTDIEELVGREQRIAALFSK